MDSKPKRRGRPLLVAAAGVAFISYVQCKEAEAPVGNLRAPDNMDAGLPSQDSGIAQATPSATAPIAPTPGPTDQPVGNLMAPQPQPSVTPTTSATVTPIHRPVGNLRAPNPTGSAKKPPPSSP